jgi:hypothetical protein
MKPIRLTKHAREQCLERGASEDEIVRRSGKVSERKRKWAEKYAASIFLIMNVGRGVFTQ